MKPIERILRINMYLLFSIFLLCSCHASTGKDSLSSGKSRVMNKVTPKTSQSVISHSYDTILINDMKFIPAVIKVNKGDTIVWINKDMVAHNVTEQTAKGWASPSLSPGATWKMAALHPAYYFCTIHPEMKGKIMIK